MKQNKTILLIDDDSDEHIWFCDAIKTYDTTISCVTAYNCSQGYNLIRENPPALIFLDYNLPGTNGMECLKKIKQTYSLQNIPVYMYSASTVSDDVKQKALKFGAVKWLKKPNSLPAYQTILSEVFE